jgi:hypothetical protein
MSIQVKNNEGCLYSIVEKRFTIDLYGITLNHFMLNGITIIYEQVFVCSPIDLIWRKAKMYFSLTLLYSVEIIMNLAQQKHGTTNDATNPQWVLPLKWQPKDQTVERPLCSTAGSCRSIGFGIAVAT